MADEGEGQPVTSKARIVVYSKMERDNVEGLIKFLLAKDHIVECVEYQQLPQIVDEINNVELRPGTVMILCHSASTGQIALTDKVGGVFDDFLPRAAKTLGKSCVAVIVNDIALNIMVTGVCAVWLRNFKRDQKTVEENSSFLQFVCALTDPMDEYTTDLLESTKYELPTIDDFLRGALGLPETTAPAGTNAPGGEADAIPDNPPNDVDTNRDQPDAPTGDVDTKNKSETPNNDGGENEVEAPENEADAKPPEVKTEKADPKPEEALPEQPRTPPPEQKKSRCSVS